MGSGGLGVRSGQFIIVGVIFGACRACRVCRACRDCKVYEVLLGYMVFKGLQGFYQAPKVVAMLLRRDRVYVLESLGFRDSRVCIVWGRRLFV